MPQDPSAAPRSPFGRVTIGPQPVPPGGGGRDGDGPLDRGGSSCTWRPRGAIAGHLPPGHTLPMTCLAAPGGPRRFVPAMPTANFLLHASLGGLAILQEAGKLPEEQAGTYHAMRLIYQHATLQREHLGRSFKTSRDLRVHAAVRGAVGAGDILPDDLGRDGSGAGRRWTIAELLDRGRAHARLRDGEEPGPGRCIAAGLYVAAARDPLDPGGFSPAQSLGLVHQGLFDLGPSPDPVDPATKLEVTDRLMTFLAKHLRDDTATFDRRFFRDRENLILAIAKQEKGAGPIPREAVRQALLGLVVQSHRHLGDCLHIQMRDFARALPVPMTPGEAGPFRAVYARQAYLGGLPLILLKDRFPFLKDAVLAILEDPDDRARQGVLLRMLEYYGSMVAKRRRADREDKRLRPGPRPGPGTAPRASTGRVASDGDRSDPASAAFTAVAISCGVGRRIRCRCADSERWTGRLVEESPAIVTVEVECSGCGRVSEVFGIPRPEFEACARARIG